MRKLFLIFVLILLIPAATLAQGTGFNFQGRLNDGSNPANGSYDLQFRLFNAITGGTQIGATISRPSTTLINGVFSVTLDFGATAFDSPNAVFMEIGVKPANSPNAYTILGPRQQLTVVPLAIKATNADNATNAVNAQNAANASNSNTLNGLSSNDFIRNSIAPIANQNFNIVGNGVINGNLNVAGNITNGGNVVQNRDKNGSVKAMVYVDQFANIVRCYNGVTGSTTGDCGISVDYSGVTNPGVYAVDFPFQVYDRFLAVTPGTGSSVTLSASFRLTSNLPNRVIVETRITDVDHKVSGTSDDFMIIVY